MVKNSIQNKWGPALIVLLTATVVFFYNLGEISLWDPDEPRGAVIADEMLKKGDWIHLSYNGQPVTENPALVKPPLYYWSIAAFSALRGHVDELSARLPSALAGIGTALLVFFLGARIFGTKTGLFGGLIFISNHMLFEQARSAEIDMTLTFLITAALFLFYHCYHGHFREGWLYPAYGALGLSVLAKGPVGVIVPLMVAFIYLLARWDLKALGKMKLLAGLLIIFLVASPWFILEGRAFGMEFFFRQNFERFFHAFDHIQPWYYYLVKLPVHFLPWTLLLPATIAYGFRSGKEKNPGRTFLWIWFLAVLIFFSLSESKRSLYIVPLYPALSLLVAEALERITKEERFAPLLFWIRGGSACFALILVAAGGAAAWLALTRFPDLGRPVALFVIVALAGAALLYRMIRKGVGRGLVTALLLCAVGLELLLAGIVYPAIDVKSRSSKKLCRMVATRIGEKDLGCVGFHPPSAIFYINRGRQQPLIDFKRDLEAGITFLQQQKTVYCLMDRKIYEGQKDRLDGISREVLLPGFPGKGWKWDVVFLTNGKDAGAEEKLRL